MKRMFYFLITILTISVVSCNNNEIPSDEEHEKKPMNGSNSQDSSEENSIALPEDIRKKMLTHNLLATFCLVDSIDDSTFIYRPQYGRQDEMDTNAYLFKAVNKNDAYSFFIHLIPTNERAKILEVGNTSIYSIDENRTLRYTYIGSTDIIATIEFDFPEISNIKKYVYIPADLWPYNDSTSPFLLGSIWKHIDETKYVCVKEYCGRNDPGILMTFDKGWQTVELNTYYNDVPFLINCASKWAWQKLEDLYMHYPMMFKNAVEEGVIPVNLQWGYKYTLGGVEVKNWTTGWWLWEEKYHECTVHNVWIENGKFKFEDYSWSGGMLTSRSNMGGSSHIEFGNTMPSGKWEQISF